MNTLAAYQARLSDPSDVAGAYAFCLDLASSHYENFPVASRLLAPRLRPHVAALYAFARIADDFSDEAEHEGFREERLRDWRRQLRAAGQGPAARQQTSEAAFPRDNARSAARQQTSEAAFPRDNARSAEHPVFLALGRTLKELELPLEPFDDLLSAFLQDAAKKRYATFDEVLDYCRRSANPVGRIVLLIHGYRGAELFRYSDAICTALQLANFWQDLAVDLKKDRIYLPQEDFAAFGYSEADLRMGVVNDRFRALMKFQVNRTRALFEQGRPLAAKLRWPLSWEIRLTWFGGREILRKIRRMNFDTLAARPILSRWDWLPLLARVVLQS